MICIWRVRKEASAASFVGVAEIARYHPDVKQRVRDRRIVVPDRPYFDFERFCKRIQCHLYTLLLVKDDRHVVEGNGSLKVFHAEMLSPDLQGSFEAGAGVVKLFVLRHSLLNEAIAEGVQRKSRPQVVLPKRRLPNL